MRPTQPLEESRLLVQHGVISIETTRPVEFVDITATLTQALDEVGLTEGILIVVSQHTTTGLMINEHEPMLLGDLETLFTRIAPAGDQYGHDDFSRRTVNLTPDERRNGHAHCRAALLRTSESLTVTGGRLNLGRWQRVFFVEFDGGQRRDLFITLIGL
jgi:secondary thiamine-phosphate synthase enzyme